MHDNLPWYGYPSPEGMVVGARVGVALGVSDVSQGGGSVGLGVGSSVGICVWVGVRVGILVGGAEVVEGIAGASSGKLGTYRRCPVKIRSAFSKQLAMRNASTLSSARMLIPQRVSPACTMYPTHHAGESHCVGCTAVKGGMASAE
jgi:hypothetical protein